MLNQEEREQREIRDLLGAIAMIDYLESRQEEEQERPSKTPVRESYTNGEDYVGLLFICIVALMLLYFELGTTGIIVFAVSLIVLFYILFKTSVTIGDVVQVAIGLIIISWIPFSIESNSIQKFETNFTSQLYQKDWTRGSHGEEYLFQGLDYPLTLPFTHGDENVEKFVYMSLSDFNERAAARKANRKLGFYVVDNPKMDRTIEAYFVGKRIVLVSDNVPEGISKDIQQVVKKHSGKRFDWQTYKAKKEKKS